MIRQNLVPLIAAEVFAGAVGFGVMVTLGRRLGPRGFADFEYASAIAAWWLVLVRGGFDVIVTREAARRPRLIAPLTDLLIGMRLASALVGLTVVFLIAWSCGADRGSVVAMAGLVLIVSGFASDVGSRARGRFDLLAVAQAVRAIALACGVWFFVVEKSNALISTACVLGAELASTIVFLSIHFFEHGMIRPRFRSRAWAVLSRRGAIAGFTRLARVFLYSFDLLILGSLTTSLSLGPYAAARRVGFALLAIGLVVPSAMAPRFAKAWADGTAEARSMIALSTERVLMFILPAIIGLILTADRWMLTLFGEEFREGGPWLALIAAKLPLVIVSNIQQTALIACRRELWGLRLILAMSVAGLVLIPLLAAIHGIFGVAWGLLAIEAMGAISGWFLLARLGVAPRWQHASTPVLAGCVALILVCLSGHEWGLVSLVVASAATYGLVLASFRAGLPARIERVVPVAAGGRPS